MHCKIALPQYSLVTITTYCSEGQYLVINVVMFTAKFVIIVSLHKIVYFVADISSRDAHYFVFTVYELNKPHRNVQKILYNKYTLQ